MTVPVVNRRRPDARRAKLRYTSTAKKKWTDAGPTLLCVLDLNDDVSHRTYTIEITGLVRFGFRHFLLTFKILLAEPLKPLF